MTEFKLPELGENVHSGVVVRVLVAAGDAVKKNQSVIEVETDKAAIEVPSSVEGKALEIKVKAGDKVSPGQVIFTVEEQTASGASVPAPMILVQPQQVAPTAKPVASPAPAVAPAQTSELPSVAAAPSVRRFAREIGIDIAQVRGTGPDGQISVEDVKAFAQARPQSAASATPAVRAMPKLPDFSQWGPVERQPMSGIRRATSEHMSAAWTIPHVTQYDRTDITEFEALRKKHSSKENKVTVTAVALKIVAAALKHFPQFNVSLDEASGEIVYKKYYHIGVAVDTDRGLLVPVIRDVDKKSILDLSIELAQLAGKARDKKISLEDMKGGTFTITNLGGIGGTNFSPIVNWPEAAILGMARSSVEPVFINGAFAPRLMLPLSLSYDHRVIDGADAARFLRWVSEAFAQPVMLAFEGMI